MKKMIGYLLAFVLVTVGLINVDWNRLGKENVYLQVSEATDVEETTLDSGEVIRRYVYETEAYTAEGEAQRVTFSAAKALREGAFLMLYMKDDAVTSYDEIEMSDMPKAVQNKM
ncbi:MULTISPECIES: YxeA family protein [Exiguobacterium]|uniref:YxeA family protein n=1 Tax=Exiguobacterium TaxID=33986 RepID=UPI001BE8B47C|nr:MULTISPECIES: YxeA family protein [Exiguobacterium]MCT4781685.1 YxeA family protein [Exiguobacterium himgiriensis]